MAKLIYAYDTRTGEQVTHPVPEHWLGHPKLGEHLSRTKPRPQKRTVNNEADEAQTKEG